MSTESQTRIEQIELDVRSVEPKHRYDLIIGTYESLAEGAAMQLIVDHDPTCMYYTLKETRGEDTFDFEYLEQGPIDWRVIVRKR
jgi:uncharacterized protein (DUF2249 family)